MSLTYFKATRTNGRDFRTDTVDYAGHLASGEVLTHPAKRVRDEPSTYFSVSVEPGETLIGGSWPCRLFRVEPVGTAWTHSGLPYKRCLTALRVAEELPAWQALGPNGREVAAIVARCRSITADEARSLRPALGAALDAALDAARDAALDAAWDAALDAAWGAALDAAWGAALDAAWVAARGGARRAALDAALAWLVLDKLTEDQFQALAGPWLSVIGEPVIQP